MDPADDNYEFPISFKNRPEEKILQPINMKKGIHDAINWIEAQHNGQDPISGIRTGYPDLDKATGGLMADIYVVGAGDSMLAVDFALNVSLEICKDAKVAYFAPAHAVSDTIRDEKKRKRIPHYVEDILLRRMIAIDSRVNFQNMREGFLAERDFPKITNTAGKIYNGNISFYNSECTAYSLATTCKRLADGPGLDLVVIDKLQRLYQFNDNSALSMYQKGKDIAATLEDMVKESGLTVLVLSELKKGAGKRESLSPDDLRDFGTLADDHPIFLVAEDKTDEEDMVRRCAIPITLSVHNNFYGRRKEVVSLTYLEDYFRFESAAKISPEFYE